VQMGVCAAIRVCLHLAIAHSSQARSFISAMIVKLSVDGRPCHPPDRPPTQRPPLAGRLASPI
jgi:hypothetical protein